MTHLGLALLLVTAGCDASIDASITRGDEVVWRGTVRVARDEEERRRGLADESGLPADRGLVLEAPIEDELCVTNGPVSFAIDVAYADDAGVLGHLERDVPSGDPSVLCFDPTRRILETAAGALRDVRVGDILRVED